MDIDEPQQKRELETVLPLVNIVFLLLIFFMLAGAFTKADLFTISVPDASADTEANANDIMILMNSNSELAIEKTPYTEDQLIDFIQKTLVENQVISVQLKADKKVKSKDLIDIMEKLGAAGLQSIRLLTVINPDNSESF
ncbi:MAG: biopolymer transporter ExbD [Pseudomonadota bacterium]